MKKLSLIRSIHYWFCNSFKSRNQTIKMANTPHTESYSDIVARIEKHLEVSFACSIPIDTSVIARSLADYEIERQKKATLKVNNTE